MGNDPAEIVLTSAAHPDGKRSKRSRQAVPPAAHYENSSTCQSITSP